MIDTSLNSSNFYFLFAVLQGLILTVIILGQKKFRLPNLYLGLLIFFFSLSLLHLVLEESIHIFNAKFPIPMDFSMAYGPLAYLHVLSIKSPNRRFRKKDLIHFLPSLLIDGIFYSAMFIYLGNRVDWAYDNITTIQTIGLTTGILGLVQLTIYSLLINKEARAARSGLKDFAGIKRWMKIIYSSWITFIVLLLIAITIALFNVEQLDENSELLYKPFSLILGLLIYGLGYLYLLKYMKLIGPYMDRMTKISLTEDEIVNKKEVLLKHLQQHRLYEEATLTLAKLAKSLDWPITDVSFVINDGMATNFNDFINQLRVARFQQLVVLPENKKYSIVGLAQQVGFSSKASFYRAFKKETGTTPTAFLKENSPE
jgi:AraC-like DNA-binding protein